MTTDEKLHEILCFFRHDHEVDLNLDQRDYEDWEEFAAEFPKLAKLYSKFRDNLNKFQLEIDNAIVRLDEKIESVGKAYEV